MADPFHQQLAELITAQSPPYQHRVAAGFLDEEDYTRLKSWYHDAVSILTQAFGTPLQAPCRVLDPIDVEHVTCWHRPAGIAYIMLWWGDNTRVRILELGLVTPGERFAPGDTLRPDITDWWQRPPGCH